MGFRLRRPRRTQAHMEISARGRSVTARRRSTPVAKTKVQNGNGNGHGGPDGAEFDSPKLLRALQAVRDGDLTVRLPPDQTGIGGKIADAFNEMVSGKERISSELERVGQMVGKEGKTRIRVASEKRSGAWGEM